MTSPTHITSSKGITAKVIRTSRRKTAQVRVDQGSVSILVPDDLSESRIEQILTNKTKWIQGKLYLHGQASPSKPKEYVSGESFSYLGRNYRLKVVRGPKSTCKLIAGRLVVTLPSGENQPQNVQKALIAWYRHHADQKIPERASRYAKLVGVEPKTVGVRDFKSRWGSCHKSGDILINWRIVMAPSTIVDYVVAHELCHLKFHDHSPEFWKELGKVIPNYLDCREWLRVNGRSLGV
tara:strand:- start:3719 stop:4429 length:711 start_codon:yes stop_codon:yes gene_type:complete